jgi:hypothetical protein
MIERALKGEPDMIVAPQLIQFLLIRSSFQEVL